MRGAQVKMQPQPAHVAKPAGGARVAALALGWRTVGYLNQRCFADVRTAPASNTARAAASGGRLASLCAAAASTAAALMSRPTASDAPAAAAAHTVVCRVFVGSCACVPLGVSVCVRTASLQVTRMCICCMHGCLCV